MKASELADFVSRVRRLFGGPMDEELFALAKERIAGLHSRPCEEALDEYALAHGGPRSRFIPAKFLEVYTRRTEKLDARADALSREALKRKAATAASMEAQQVEREWRSIRDRLASMPAAALRAATDRLRLAGWTLDRDQARWTDTQALAVFDIATEATVMVRDRETGEWNVPVPAIRFWTEVAPNPSHFAAEALARAEAPRRASDREGAGGDSRGVHEPHVVAASIMQVDDEIPF